MKDLTKGKISTLILGFAIPVFLGNLLQLTYSLADTRIVGSFLGERSLAAVGATTTISNLIVGFLLGLANGFAIITAQKFGAGDKKRVRRSFAIALVLGVIVSAILILIGTVFINPILGFLNVPGKLFIEAKQYILIIIIGLWVTMFYDILMAVMRAIGDTLTPLLILAIKNKMITFGVGPAGTGKTYLAMAMAITAFKNDEVSRIILTRPAIGKIKHRVIHKINCDYICSSSQHDI